MLLSFSWIVWWWKPSCTNEVVASARASTPLAGPADEWPHDVQGDWDEFFHPGSPLRFVISLWLTPAFARSLFSEAAVDKDELDRAESLLLNVVVAG